MDKKTINNSIDNSTNNSIDNKVYNNQNLKPYNKTDNRLSKEEAMRRGRIGGKKSGEVRKARKTMKETILDMLSKYGEANDYGFWLNDMQHAHSLIRDAAGNPENWRKKAYSSDAVKQY